jgi:predicted DNA-binding antitoxin AbrB/MazE fold protein
MTIRAVYQDGVFRPLQPLEITEGTEVEVTVPKKRKQPPSPEEVIERLLRISDMPSEGKGPFSGEDHDKILYGEAPNK